MSTPEEQLRDNLAFMAMEVIKLRAQCQILLEAVAEITSEDEAGATAARKALWGLVNERQEQMLLNLEDLNPGLAALLDKGRGPFPDP